jgi:serine protease Do
LPAFRSSVRRRHARHASLPDFTELVEQNGPAVVNISTTQKVRRPVMLCRQGLEMPDLPEGTPWEESVPPLLR